MKHFDIIASLEADGGYGVPTQRLNFPDLPIHYGPAAWPIDELKAGPPIDFIYGNPPCAAWSGNNARSHDPSAWRQDPRVNCTYHHFGLLEALRPKIWAWESVTQAPDKGKELVDELTARAMTLGYSITQIFHDARWLGVPQIRKRWFMVAHRVGFRPHAPNWAPPTTVSQALRGVRPRGAPATDRVSYTEHVVPLLPLMPQGMRVRRLYEKRVAEGHPWACATPGFGEVRLRADQPATATVGYSFIHPTQHRFLSLNEVAVLGGFPEDYHFHNGHQAGGSAALDLISRGVCPPVGEWLARSVASNLSAQLVIEPITSVIDYRLPPPQEVHVPRLAQIRQATPSVAEALRASRKAVAQSAGRPPDCAPGEGSGAYMRRLIPLGHDAAAILEAVHHQFPGSKAGPSDVSYNRNKLKKEGAPFDGGRPVKKGDAVRMNGEAKIITKVMPTFAKHARPPVPDNLVKVLGPDGRKAAEHVTKLDGRGGELRRIGRALQEIGAALAKMGGG